MIVRFVFCVALTVLLTNCKEQVSYSAHDFSSGELKSAEACGDCHKDIYAFWKSSDHAQSATNPVFRTALLNAESAYGESARELCLRCHAPASIQTGVLDLDEPLANEGVGCDFCHSIKEVNLDQSESPFVLEVGSTKFGTSTDSAPEQHKVVYSELLAGSASCSGCHEFRNSGGVAILSTYSEWLEYIRSGGQKDCQDCHMELSLGGVAEPRAKRISTAYVNLHSLSDVHSVSKLRRSVRLRILSIKREDDRLSVSVEVSNVGAGHKVPTGSPLKKVALQVEVELENGEKLIEEKVYEKVFLDKDGHAIKKDSQILLEPVSFERDTRISPGEDRIEDFQFAIPKDMNLEVKATLIYSHSPHDHPDSENRKVFFTEKKKLISHWSRQAME